MSTALVPPTGTAEAFVAAQNMMFTGQLLENIVRERCNDDAVLRVDLRSVAIEEPVTYGVAPALMRTILTHGPDNLRAIVAIRAMDEDLYTPMGMYSTNLTEEVSPTDQVIALSMIHNEAREHLNEPVMFERVMKLMSTLDGAAVAKVKD
jgi:hypothetical protein